ncbi:MAG: sugar phosphate isomerase/epimerase [Candidatus Latescibacteria bacterium]|nr:sugar phosphate isomerase/epimerase [Candidatus Latescibacterota bacterium]
MQIGIMAKTFVRPTLGDVLDVVGRYSLRAIQFSFSCAGLPNMPDRIDPAQVERIHVEMDARAITMAAVSGTFNMIDPDLSKRRDGLRRLREMASVCARLVTPVITLCTGTRDPDNMWRRHPDNDSPTAWRDLVVSMTEAVQYAEEFGVTLAFEPEVSNVVDSAHKARRLLDEVRSPRLKVVMDGANLFHAGELPRMREILNEAFDLLGPDIVLAHAKDLSQDGEAGHEAAGTGRLDYDHYLMLLRAAGYDGALILHSLDETQVAGCIEFLRSKTIFLSP